jgi:hypothetical protein
LLILWPRICRWAVPLKCQLIFHGLHRIISQTQCYICFQCLSMSSFEAHKAVQQ